MEGVRFQARARDFSLLRSAQTGSEAYPATVPLIQGVKRSGREASFHLVRRSRIMELCL
jgi:hypothetical protein